MHKWLTLAATAAAALASTSAVAAEHLANGGFEADLTAWTVQTGEFAWTSAPGMTHSGARMAATGCVGAECLTENQLSQTVATQAGGVYRLSFWMRTFYNEGFETPDVLDELVQVLWNGAVVAELPYDGQTWSEFAVDGLRATGPSTTLAFAGRNDHGFSYLDDVSLGDGGGLDAPPDGNPNPGAIPEPGVWALMILGFGIAGVAARRRRPTASAVVP